MLRMHLLFPALLIAAHSVQAQEPTPAASLSVSVPADYQVFQRTKSTEGKIAIRGQFAGVTAVEARIGDGRWQALEMKRDAGTFSGELAAPAGGWYKLEVRGLDGGKVLAEKSVEHVGIGEVFIVAGQSNSANYGSEKQKTETGKVACFDGAKWSPANDPQGGAKGTGGSFMPAFGDALSERYKVPIAVVPCGIGSTSVRQWLPQGERMAVAPTTSSYIRPVGPDLWECTGQPFDGLAKRLKSFGPQGVRAVLWHQGESDCGQATEHEITGEQYGKYAAILIRASRKEAGWDVPWFVAQASYHGGRTPLYEGIRSAQASLWKDGFALRGPDTDTLKEEYRAGVHFNAKGLRDHGRLWAEKVAVYLDGRFDTEKKK